MRPSRSSPSPPGKFRHPVVILAGGADGEDPESAALAKSLLLAAFAGFAGTLVSGGTTSGVAGIAGDIAVACRRAQVIGYLPRRTGTARRDRRYTRFRTTPGRTFTVAECLLYWSDLIAAGVDPAAVILLGWGGGRIAALEYRIALLLGARVGVVSGSGRSADALRADRRWSRLPRLVFLARNAASIRAFLAPPPSI
jgi:hypothetical protein